MSRRYQWSILGAFAGVYLVALGLLTGVASERFRFDGVRTSILHQLDEAAQRARERAMAWERDIQRNTPPAATPRTEASDHAVSWAAYLEMADAALGQRDLASADRAWREAHASAVRTRAWRPLVEVGDAAIRLGAVDASHGPYVARARDLYLAALNRARAERSVDGVLQVAEAFHAIGDHRVVEQCLLVAERLGAGAENATIVRLRVLAREALDARPAPRIEP
jgi:hypothetical protein